MKFLQRCVFLVKRVKTVKSVLKIQKLSWKLKGCNKCNGDRKNIKVAKSYVRDAIIYWEIFLKHDFFVKKLYNFCKIYLSVEEFFIIGVIMSVYYSI